MRVSRGRHGRWQLTSVDVDRRFPCGRGSAVNLLNCHLFASGNTIACAVSWTSWISCTEGGGPKTPGWTNSFDRGPKRIRAALTAAQWTRPPDALFYTRTQTRIFYMYIYLLCLFYSYTHIMYELFQRQMWSELTQFFFEPRGSKNYVTWFKPWNLEIAEIFGFHARHVQTINTISWGIDISHPEMAKLVPNDYDRIRDGAEVEVINSAILGQRRDAPRILWVEQSERNNVCEHWRVGFGERNE